MGARGSTRRGRDGSDRSLAPWIAAAALLHAIATVATYATRGATPASSPRVSARAPELVELSLEVLAPGTDPAAATEPRPATASARPASTTRARATSAGAVATGSIPETEPAELRTTPAAGFPVPKEAGPSLSIDALGVGASNPFLTADARDATDYAEDRVEHSMRAALVERDRVGGMARGGPVVEALHAAARHVASPLKGTALFLATTDASGLVFSLEPVSVSSDHPAWQKVAAETLRQLAAKRLRVPSGARGLSIRLALRSKNQLPSGRAPGVAAKVLGVPVAKGDGPDSTSMEILTPHVSFEPVEIELPGGEVIKIPAIKVFVNLFGLSGDPVDIGADAQRGIHVQIVEERPL